MTDAPDIIYDDLGEQREGNTAEERTRFMTQVDEDGRWLELSVGSEGLIADVWYMSQEAGSTSAGTWGVTWDELIEYVEGR